jgi:putative ABC transport system permease protein
MTVSTLIRRSVWYHRRALLGVFLGIATTTAVITGALLVGDSVRHSLLLIARERIGNVAGAMAGGDRFVRTEVAEELVARNGAPAAAAIHLSGIAIAPDHDRRTHDVQIYGVDAAFAELGYGWPHPGAGEIAVNRKLAGRLGVAVGDTILLKVEQPSFLSRDATLAAVEQPYVTLRVTVSSVLEGEGNFSLRRSQLSPYNAFVDRESLQKTIKREGLANLVVTSSAVSPDALIDFWQPLDAGLERIVLSDTTVELRCHRVFFDETTAAAALAIPEAAPVLTYFVNEIRSGERTTPYSMVTALDPKLLPISDLQDDEIILNEWCAEDLNANVGALVTLTFFVLDRGRELATQNATFKVRAIVPTEADGIDRSLMPDFPGLSVAENCSDWDTGMPIDLQAIRPKDESYWDDHRGTPKALINWQTGRRIWNNRFGSVTAVRYPKIVEIATTVDLLTLEQLTPSRLNLQFEAVADLAKTSAMTGMDFGGLFIAFSFFIIAAALLLTALLFVFHLDQRRSEHGTLAAIGFSERRIAGLYVRESWLLATVAAVIGAAAGTLYTVALVRGLGTLWQDAVGTWALSVHLDPRTYAIGIVSGVVVSILTIRMVLWRTRKASVLDRLRGSSSIAMPPGRRALLLTIELLAAAAAAAVLVTQYDSAAAPLAFFVGGALLLVAFIAGCGVLFVGFGNATKRGGVAAIGRRNIGRRPGRSLAVVGVLACAAFLIVALESQRTTHLSGTASRTSGTGGFAVFAKSTIPVYEDLQTAAVRELRGLDEPPFDTVDILSMRLVAGDDASCLNLNRALRPQLAGIDPDQFSERGAFAFQKTTDNASEPWSLLEFETGSSEIPAVIDFNTMMYSLKLGIGSTLPYVNERNEAVNVRIVGALKPGMMQGILLVDEAAVIEHFPSHAGYRMFLFDNVLDAGSDAVTLAVALNKRFGDIGFDAVPAASRLAEFNRVQDTYISIFQVLGGLGVVLGAFGLSIMVMRNVLQRRSELALMRAIGFSVSTIRRMILAEHWALLLAGLFCGGTAALVAVLPTFVSRQLEPPWAALVLVLCGVFLCGLVSTWLAVRSSLRGELVSALRSE